MTHLATPAIVLRRRDYGDFDLILTVLTPDHGLCTLIAKSAKKSVKRFQGVLEPFAGLRVVCRQGRGKSMMVLEEADLEQTSGSVRTDIVKTAYASYWAELALLWLEEGQPRPDIYRLMAYVLEKLSGDEVPAALLSLLFQMRFVGQEGLRPVLERCVCCQTDVDKIPQQQFCVDLKQGGIVCHACPAPDAAHLQLGKGNLKQLLWMADGDLSQALRVRFTERALAEANAFLEAFVPFHIGRMPKSLGFLRQVRNGRTIR